MGKGVDVAGCNNQKHHQDPETWLHTRLGPRKSKAKLKEIEAFFCAARTFAERQEV
jgi:hypothetical protein